MPHTAIKNDKTERLANIFAGALRPFVPGITASDINVEGLKLHDVPEIEITTTQMNMRMMGLTEEVNFHAQTDITFPTIKDRNLVQALQKATKLITGHWVSYSASDISIKADLNDTAEMIDDEMQLHQAVGTYKRLLDAGIDIN